MSENFIRHLIAIVGFLIAASIFLAAYFAGTRGWWWAGLTVFFIYFIVYKLVDV